MIKKFQNAQALFFDVDGVIFDSNKMKIKAFYDIAKKHFGEEVASVFSKYTVEYWGTSRYVMFKKLLTDYAKIDETDEKFESLYNEFLEEYATSVKKGYLTADFISGFTDFIVLTSDVKKFTVSGSNEKELEAIFEHKNIKDKFNKIYGSPKTKIEILKTILDNDKSLNPSKCFYFGDARSDYLAAKEFGINFVFMHGVSDWSEGQKELEKEESVISVKNWNNILKK